jgi:hypothetical protein
MQPRTTLSVDEIHLSDLAFWVRPLEEREGAFATLRAASRGPFVILNATDLSVGSSFEFTQDRFDAICTTKTCFVSLNMYILQSIQGFMFLP